MLHQHKPVKNSKKQHYHLLRALMSMGLLVANGEPLVDMQRSLASSSRDRRSVRAGKLIFDISSSLSLSWLYELSTGQCDTSAAETLHIHSHIQNLAQPLSKHHLWGTETCQFTAGADETYFDLKFIDWILETQCKPVCLVYCCTVTHRYMEQDDEQDHIWSLWDYLYRLAKERLGNLHTRFL